MTSPATVFIVDDDAFVRDAVRRLIRSVGLNARTYGSAQEFLDHYDDAQPGCIVLDVRMPGLSGLDLQEKLLTDAQVRTPVIFMTGHGDVPMSVRAMKAGAVDFIQKPFTDQTLLDAIRRAINQDTQVRREQAERQKAFDRLAVLTHREREVMLLVVGGKMNKEIAAALGISQKTVKIHRARVMEKTQVDSLAHLVLLAQTAGLCRTKDLSA